jgi:hypothetical protein
MLVQIARRDVFAVTAVGDSACTIERRVLEILIRVGGLVVVVAPRVENQLAVGVNVN